LTYRNADVDFMVFPNGRMTLRHHSNRLVIPVNDVAATSSTKIGEFVRQRRRANHLTQRQLGELAGVGLRLVSELERGKVTLRMDGANRVLAVFGMMLGPVEAPRSDGGDL
jgi:y4mF family transcriptional regulator